MPLLETWPPDVLVLDVMLPGPDGFALLPEIRRLTTAPVVMLTARTEIAEKVAGLSAGADDYVGKPFDFEELVARLRTLLRRPSIEGRETLEYADLSIDTPSRTVHRGNRRIELSAREFDLLRVFAEHAEASADALGAARPRMGRGSRRRAEHRRDVRLVPARQAR